MIFRRINRDSPEQIFIVVRANEAGVAADDVLQLELTAASVDGVYVVQPNTGELNATIGIADAAIANAAYGLAQIYGYRSTARVLQTGATLTLGVALGPTAGSDMLQTVASIAPAYMPAFVLLETAASAAGADSTISKKIFIRAM